MTTGTLTLVRPQPDEYASYYGRYISLIDSDDVLTRLEQQGTETVALFSQLSADKAGFRYAPGKWSVKEVFGHMIDTERILAYRALRIARGDRTPIESFEQDDYVRNGGFDHRTLADLTEEFQAVRTATLHLFRHFDATAVARRGIANKNEVSVRALAYIIAGHEQHHRRVIEEKYLK